MIVNVEDRLVSVLQGGYRIEPVALLRLMTIGCFTDVVVLCAAPTVSIVCGTRRFLAGSAKGGYNFLSWPGFDLAPFASRSRCLSTELSTPKLNYKPHIAFKVRTAFYD